MMNIKQIRSNQSPTLSVIIPAYNQARYLGQAVQSVLDQTYQSYEIIIVDDESTDETPQIAAAFGEQVRYIRQENRGLAGARNTGIRAARGAWVSLLDSDDRWRPTYLERVMAAVQGENADVLYCAAQCIDAGGQASQQFVGYHPMLGGNLYDAILRSNFIIPSTVTIRKVSLEQAGLFDERFRSLEDTDLWLRLLQRGAVFVGIPEVLVEYRVHGSSLSTNVSRMQQSARGVVEKHFGADDGQPETWTAEKRRAYGGLYRYQVLSSIQRQDNWDCAGVLCSAVRADPTLSRDLSFFYELALGSQPYVVRGSAEAVDIAGNAGLVEKLLREAFEASDDTHLNELWKTVQATAWKALGVAAYNTGQMGLFRRYAARAAGYDPKILLDRLLLGNLVKSWLGSRQLERLRQWRNGMTTYSRRFFG